MPSRSRTSNWSLGLLVLIMGISTFSCSSSKATVEAEAPVQKKRPVSVELGKIFQKDGRKWLYGGQAEEQHFDITDCALKDAQFHYGIGREKFPALLEPRFISVAQAKAVFKDDDRFLLLEMGQDIRAYSIEDLTRHEVVNDVVDSQPVMAAYCILADLGAIYDRRHYDRPFTFALSGYTYYDPDVWDGLDGFVLWDRETESLWWPLTGEAVSGPMKGTRMKVLDQKHWAQTTWKVIRKKYPNADVLKPGQDFERPSNWLRYDDIESVKKREASSRSVSPRWGENEKIGG